MTTFPTLSAADQIAAMEARAETERTIYGQTTVPAMLLQGAAWGREVERLRQKLHAMHRRAQRAEGRMSRTDVLLRSVHGYIKHVHEKKDTHILWYWMRQHLRAAMEHARAGTGRAFSVHFTYYHDQLLDLQAQLKAAEAKLAALEGPK